MLPGQSNFPRLSRTNLNEIAMGSYAPLLVDSYVRAIKTHAVQVYLLAGMKN